MRIDDDILEAARSLAKSEERSLGEVISELARRGLAPSSSAMDHEEGFPVFSVSSGASPITPEMVRKAEEPDS